jgi:hypothetical protein
MTAIKSSARDNCLITLLGLAVMTVTPATAIAQPVPDQPLYMKDINAFRNKSLEAKVQELADREEIRELIATYAQRVAHGKSIANLFTDDGAYIHIRPGAPTREVRGRKALDDYFQDRSPDVEHPMPMIHNHLISIRGDEATGINSNELRISENGNSIIASGYYEDRYRRENGRWRFVERKITFFHWVPIQKGWARPVKPD